MDSNKKRKRAEKEPNEERDRYYKKLRREQEKRRQKRKKALAAKEECNAPRGDSVKRRDSRQNKKPRIDIDNKLLTRGKVLLSAALEKGIKVRTKETKVETAKVKKSRAPVVPEKSSSDQNDLKEIKVSRIKRDEGKGAIGTGTFGSCYLARFRGLRVVQKVFRERNNISVEKLRKEAAYEARVVQRLGDHPGIPLLFGVMLQQPLVALVFQFHGDNDRSLTLYKAAKEKLFTKNQVWTRVLTDVAVALDHIHGCGFIHNDLKSNNVVVEEREGHPSPVIIDFGKSVLAEKAKVPRAKPRHVSSEFSYVAPELRNSTGKPSTSSDVYSLAFMIKSLFKRLNFKSNTTVENAVEKLSDFRPSLRELKDSLV